MGDFLIMSKKERERKANLEAVLQGRMRLVECQKRLDISYRQAKRILKRYREEGDLGLCHKNRGNKPANAYLNNFKSEVLAIYEKKYIGFGPTLASEKLEEDDKIKVNDETLRLWLKDVGLWTKKRKHVVYRERRERRPQFGDLLQIDGSIHQWFSTERYDCLLNMVDDATGITFALLDTGETTQILLTCLMQWIEKYGIPKAVYVDLKSVYVGAKHLKGHHTDDGYQGSSVFEQVCRQLNIEIIKAYSPQAKGRVERKHRVFQDRFLKDLKLYTITTLEDANAHLQEKFLKKINDKFSIAPKNSIDGHRDFKPYGNLKEIICWRYERQLRNDWTIRFKNTYFQVRKSEKNVLIKPGDFITVKKYLDGSLGFWYGNTSVKYGELSRKPTPVKTPKSLSTKLATPCSNRKKPAPNHPWRKTSCGRATTIPSAVLIKKRIESNAKRPNQVRTT